LNLEGAVGKRTKETPSKIQIENKHPRVFDRIFVE
jgi:hypothetical protein